MRVTRRDIKVILLLIGILSAFITYQFYLKTKLDDIDKVKDQITTLKAEIDDLRTKKRSENLFGTSFMTPCREEVNQTFP